MPGILTSISLSAQKKVDFIGKQLLVPKGCDRVSNFEISCDNFEMSWLYMEKANIELVLFDVVKNLEKTSKYSYKPVRLLIDSIPASGFIVSFTANHIVRFQLYAAGTVRGQSVLIQAMDLVPFWRYENHNELFNRLIIFLPDAERPENEEEK